MSTPRLLSTKEAEDLYGLPAETFARWCREGNLAGAEKIAGEWRIPQEAIEAFLNANLRPHRTWVDALAERPLGSLLSAVASILGFVVDSIALYDIIQGGNRTFLWVLAGVLSVALWLVAWFIHSAKVRTGILGYDGPRPVYKEEHRYTNRLLRGAALLLLWSMPAALALGVVGYTVWRVIPLRQTVVLVADFVDPTGVDSARVTQSLVEGMQTALAEHDDIQVRRLNRALSPDKGSEEARRLGNRPEYKAAFVIWGDYTLQPDPEVHMRFEILRQTETYLGTGLRGDYGPAQVQQPTFFDFKVQLSQYLAQVTAFAVGLTLFDADRNLEAIPYFDTAGQVLDSPVAGDLARALRFYRGTNYLSLGRVKEAAPDLRILVSPTEMSVQTYDEFALAALGNLSLVEQDLREYAAAQTYLEQALAIIREEGPPKAKRAILNNFGLTLYLQGNLKEARAYLEKALHSYRSAGDQKGEASVLNNLGLVVLHQRRYKNASKYYLEPALELYRAVGYPIGEAMVLNNMGMLAQREGDYDRAQYYYEQALKIYQTGGNNRGVARVLVNLSVLVRPSDGKKAKEYLRQALGLRKAMSESEQAQLLGALGLLNYDQGSCQNAEAYFKQAQELHRKLGQYLDEASDWRNLGKVAKNCFRNFTASSKYFEKARDIHQRKGAHREAAQDLIDLARIALKTHDCDMARSYLEQASDLDQSTANTVSRLLEESCTP